MEAISPDQRLADRYVLEAEIATGGMATVWRARDEVLARIVAVKILRDDLARDADFAERFRREAIAAARLTHPGIVSVFDTGSDGDVSYLVMEYGGERTLAHVMAERGPLGPEQAAGYIDPVLGALDYAHGEGIVHRDVKPANVLVGDDGRVRVTDFGIAKAAFAGHDLTTTGNVLGTVRYLSPEQVQGDPVDPRSDLYSAGIVLYELLTGRPPFQAETDLATAMMRLSKDPAPPRNVRPSIPRQLESVVLRAMARRPEERFQTAGEFRAALERTAGGRSDPALSSAVTGRLAPVGRTAVHPPVPEVSRPARGGVFRSWMLVPLVVLAAAAAAIAGGLALGRLELGGPLGLRGAAGDPGGASRLTTFPVQRAQDVDPQGDGSENPGEVALATDGDPSTAWATDHYNTGLFGNLKQGVGLWLDLGPTVHVTRVTIRSPVAGWAFQLQPGASPERVTDPLEATDGETTFTAAASGKTVVDLKGADTSGILVWITKLGPDGGRFAAAIGEVTVAGPS